VNPDSTAPELSFIIASWNAAAYCAKCIASILASGVSRHFEIVVVDNASSDGTPEMVEKRFPGVSLFRNGTNAGFAGAINRGISLSRGAYICIVNSDVVVAEGCVDALLFFMEKNPQVGMTGPQIVGPDGDIRRSCMKFPTLYSTLVLAVGLDTVFPNSKVFGSHLTQYRNQDSPGTVEVINGCFWLVRRTALEAVGLLDEHFFFYGEDIDWCRRFKTAAWGVVFYPEAKAMHYGGASTAAAPVRFALEQLKADLQYWRKYYSAASLFLYRALLVLHHFVRVIGHGAGMLGAPQGREMALFKVRRSVACLVFLMHLQKRPGSADAA